MKRRAGLYARVSTVEQEPENQLRPLRAFAAARGWQALEFVDRGVSGAKDRRPALDAMLAAARARKLDLVAVVKLDRIARSIHNLLTIDRKSTRLNSSHLVISYAVFCL